MFISSKEPRFNKPKKENRCWCFLILSTWLYKNQTIESCTLKSLVKANNSRKLQFRNFWMHKKGELRWSSKNKWSKKVNLILPFIKLKFLCKTHPFRSLKGSLKNQFRKSSKASLFHKVKSREVDPIPKVYENPVTRGC